MTTPLYQRPVLPDAPEVPAWVPPEPTKVDCDWAKLRTIDLSLLDSPDPAVVDGLIKTVATAIKEDGFLYIVNYGIPLEEVMRQFSIAQYTFNHISDADKQRFKWNPSSGVYSGYKDPFGWKSVKGPRDGIQHFNFYDPEFLNAKDRIPDCLLPLMPEITAFCSYLSESVNRRLLKIFSRILELPDDYLWDNIQSHGGPVADGYFRHALFSPISEEQDLKERGEGMRMNGHTDYGTTTLLFSTPISSLQIWGADRKWHYVKYSPGALVVNIGDTLEIVSGGHFKASIHRVFEPPADQHDRERLSIVQFCASSGALRTMPAYESPLIQRMGCVEEQGVYTKFKAFMASGKPVPTNKEWREAHIADSRHVIDKNNRTVVVDGVKMLDKEWMGIKVLLPV